MHYDPFVMGFERCMKKKSSTEKSDSNSDAMIRACSDTRIQKHQQKWETRRLSR